MFLDASVLLAAEDTDDAQHDAASTPLRTGGARSLDVAVYETTNVAIVRWKDPEAAKRLTQRIWMIAELGILVRVDPELSEQIARLGVEHKLSTYDAGYVAGAQRLGLTLASCDERDLVSAGLAELPTTLITG
jgi:predicted nucleic acid-binding protein